MTADLSSEDIRRYVNGKVEEQMSRLDVFAEIDSTNSYLMQAAGPLPQKICVAVTTNQTAGRGRHGKTWDAPAGSGLCLSVAYTYAKQPQNLAALTLAVGLAAVSALQAIGIDGVKIKWPNDLVVNDQKLGGILTEVQQQADAGVTVVTGIGINLALPDEMRVRPADWSDGIADLSSLRDDVTSPAELAGVLITLLYRTFERFHLDGFPSFAARWREHDWLSGRAVRIETAGREVVGIAAGIDDAGALLVKTNSDGLERVTSGSILEAGDSKAVA